MDIVITGLDSIVESWAAAAGQRDARYHLDFDRKIITVIVDNPVLMLGGMGKELYNEFSGLLKEYLPEWQVDVYPKNSNKHWGFLRWIKKLRGTT